MSVLVNSDQRERMMFWLLPCRCFRNHFSIPDVKHLYEASGIDNLVTWSLVLLVSWKCTNVHNNRCSCWRGRLFCFPSTYRPREWVRVWMGQYRFKCNPTLCTLTFLYTPWCLFMGLYQLLKSRSMIWLLSWMNGFYWISWWKPCLGRPLHFAKARVVYTLINYHMHRQLQCGLTRGCLERLLGNFTWNKKQRSRYCLVFAGWHIHISLGGLVLASSQLSNAI